MDIVYWYVSDNGHRLIIHVNFMVKCVCYMSLRSNGCFVIGAALMGSHYRMYIISDMGCVISVMDGRMQYPGHRCCITSPSGQHRPF